MLHHLLLWTVVTNNGFHFLNLILVPHISWRIMKWCPIMFPLCSLHCPHHSPLPTGEMTVRNWEERGREGREFTKSYLTFRTRTPTNLCFFVNTFSSLWLVVVRLLNKDYQIEKYWTFSNSKGFHTDFVFKNIMWEQTSLSLFTSLTHHLHHNHHHHFLHPEQWASVKCTKCSILPLSWASKTISGRVMAWWLDGLYL